MLNVCLTHGQQHMRSIFLKTGYLDNIQGRYKATKISHWSVHRQEERCCSDVQDHKTSLREADSVEGMWICLNIEWVSPCQCYGASRVQWTACGWALDGAFCVGSWRTQRATPMQSADTHWRPPWLPSHTSTPCNSWPCHSTKGL